MQTNIFSLENKKKKNLINFSLDFNCLTNEFHYFSPMKKKKERKMLNLTVRRHAVR